MIVSLCDDIPSNFNKFPKYTLETSIKLIEVVETAAIIKPKIHIIINPKNDPATNNGAAIATGIFAINNATPIETS